jgi:RNA polymerase sigma-70 factor (ECF subfamily)
MPNTSLDTVHLRQLVQRWQAGEPEAADSLLRAVSHRLERLTRRMLRSFPAVHACTETADVLQSSLLRLLNTLRRSQPHSSRHFYNLAAMHVRRELLDLARRFRSESFTRPAATGLTSDSADPGPIQAAEAPAEEGDLDLWCHFHEAVDQLPAEEREVIGLVFYHGWTQAQIAELFQVDERTVRRRWRTACVRLNQLVRDRQPTS